MTSYIDCDKIFLTKYTLEEGENESMNVQMESFLQGGKYRRLQEERILELRRKYKMRRVELEILLFLSRCGTHDTSKDIHHQLMMNKGHISQAVNSLCEKQMLIAIPDQNDRRYVHYKVADSAKEIVADMANYKSRINEQALEGISEKDLKKFKEVADKIVRNIEKLI